jgi:uncharacterized protein (DUF885 family)
MTDFGQLADKTIKCLLEGNPVWATHVGIHDYDDQLPRLEPIARRDRAARLRQSIADLDNCGEELELDCEQELDRMVLLGYLNSELIEIEKFRRWQRDPHYPLQVALMGVFLPATRDFAPAAERYEIIIKRMTQIPELLKQAQSNLVAEDGVPTVWAEMAEEAAVVAMGFFGTMVPEWGKEVPTLKSKLQSASEATVQACLEYVTFLREKLTDRSKGSYAVGEEGFRQFLHWQHALDMELDEISSIGETAIRQITAEMEGLAKRIDPDTDYREVVNRLKDEFPQETDLLDAYRNEINRLRKFIQERNLVSIPAEDELEVQPTPEFNRPTYPYAAYVPPPPFDEKKKGVFWVTPIDEEADADQQKEQRRGHNRYSLLLISLHEAYPGHHLQLLRAAGQGSAVRRLAHSSLFAEGWALYCEQLLDEVGYYRDDATRLMQLTHRLWRACRVVIDVGLHTGEMTFTEAVDMLEQIAGAGRIQAIGEVKRYTQSPTQPLSYWIGWEQLLQLRSAYKERRGEEFKLGDFHDKLLSFGTIPFGLFRERILEQ